LWKESVGVRYQNASKLSINGSTLTINGSTLTINGVPSGEELGYRKRWGTWAKLHVTDGASLTNKNLNVPQAAGHPAARSGDLAGTKRIYLGVPVVT